MNLTRKALIIFGLALILLTAILNLATRLVILPSFDKLEKQKTALDITRAVAALEDELNALDTFTNDWSQWDETYNYVQGRNPEYISDNLEMVSMILVKLNITVIADKNGRVLFHEGVDLKRQKMLSVSDGAWNRFENTLRRAHKNAPYGTRGLVLFNDKPLLVTVRPIIRTSGKGPSQGFMAMGRFLDDDMVSRIENTSQTSMVPHRLDRKSLPQDVRTAQRVLSRGAAGMTQPLSRTIIAGYGVIRDLDRKPLLMFKITQRRSIYLHGRSSLNSLAYLLVLICGLFAALAIFLMHQYLLGPVTGLIGDIISIGERGDPSARLPQVHKNELGKLTEAINTMLAAHDTANRALRESEERYRLITENMADSVWLLDMRFVPLWISPSMVRTSGYTLEEFRAAPHKKLFAPASLKKIMALIASLPDRNSPASADFDLSFADELECFRKDGSVCWAEVNINLLRDKDGRPTAILGVGHDITERKHIGEALVKAEQEKSAILNNMTELVSFQDVNHRILWANRSVADAFDLNPDIIVGKLCYELFHQRQAPCDDCPVAVTAVTGRPHRAELAGAGGRTWDIHAVPVKDTNGAIQGILEVSNDITDRKRLEAELFRIHKIESLGVFAGGIAHDFNNILTVILGNLSIARILGPDSIADLHEAVDRAQAACVQARKLTQQLLVFSKGGAPIIKIGDIAALVEETVSFALRGSNVRMKLCLPGDPWPVKMDAGQVGQVIQNLAINADQSMPKGGTLTITVENITLDHTQAAVPLPAGRYVKVTVADQGMGISEEHLQRIFDPYFTTKKAGSGLGLSIAYSVIEKHGGYITAASRVDEGSVFTFYLPASMEPLPPQPAADAKIVRGTGRILIMDDEAKVRETLAVMLKRLGYEAEEAAHGVEAIEKFKRAIDTGHPFKAVILDLTVPGGMGGKETIAALRDMDPHVKAVVASGYSNDPVMADYRAHGFSAVTAKPFGIEDLSVTMQMLFEEETG